MDFSRGSFNSGETGMQVRKASANKAQKKKINPWLSMAPSALAAAASFVPGVGTLAAGGLGAAGEFGRQKLSGEKTDFNAIAREAALSAVPGGVGFLAKTAKGARTARNASKAANLVEDASTASKVAKPAATAGNSGRKSLVRVAGEKLERTGGQMMNSQTNLTRAEMRKLGANAPDTFNKINQKYGLHNLDDIAEVSNNVTKNGIHAEGVRNIVGSGKGIDTEDVTGELTKLMDKTTLSTTERKNLGDIVSRNVQRMYAEQPLNSKANPLDAFDVSKDLREMARGYTVNKFTSTAADKAHAKVLNGLASKIEHKLYTQEGIEQAMPAVKASMVKQYKALAEEAGTNTAKGKAYLRIAKEADGAKTVAELRSAQQPWVTMGKIDDATALAQGNAAAKVATMATGGRGLVRNTLTSMADAVSPAIGGKLSQTGAKLQGKAVPEIDDALGAAEAAADSIKQKGSLVRRGLYDRNAGTGEVQGLLPQLGVRGVYNAATANPEEAAAMGEGEDPAAIEEALMSTMQGAGGEEAAAGMDALGAGSESATAPTISRENLIAAIQADPENREVYIDLYKMFAEEDAAKSQSLAGGKLSNTQQKNLTTANNAESALGELSGLYEATGGAKGPVAGRLANITASAGLNSDVSTYNQVGSSVATSLARILGQSGALSDQDQQRIAQLIPKMTDTPATAQAKLRTLGNLLQEAKANALVTTGGSGLTQEEEF